MALGCGLAVALWPGGAAAQAARCPERLRIAFPDGPSEPFMRGQGADFAQPPGLVPAARVGVTAGTRSQTLALAQGWLTEAAPSHESALQKLLAGRTPLLLVHSYYLDERLRQDSDLARQIVKLQPAVERLRLHVGALPALARSEGAFMHRLWRALCRQSAASQADGACQLPPP
ncbi:hypothetical protein DBR42_21710 [Pelomonas sp. HMWF004]|nr:hypothetical protein DBR42_21710 [Pelomonas sp. HMWF004]